MENKRRTRTQVLTIPYTKEVEVRFRDLIKQSNYLFELSIPNRATIWSRYGLRVISVTANSGMEALGTDPDKFYFLDITLEERLEAVETEMGLPNSTDTKTAA